MFRVMHEMRLLMPTTRVPTDSLKPATHSVKKRQGVHPLTLFQNKSFLFCNSRHIGHPQCLLISLPSTVCYAFVGHGFSGNIFYGLSPTVSCLNHIPGFSPEEVSIPTCFTHLHTYLSCHAIMSLNLDVVSFY